MVTTAVRPTAEPITTIARRSTCGEIYARLTRAVRQHDKARARRIYFDEIMPDKRFSRGEVTRLSFRLGAIDEGDRYLAERDDL